MSRREKYLALRVVVGQIVDVVVDFSSCLEGDPSYRCRRGVKD
jgi:hypothetical protein